MLCFKNNRGWWTGSVMDEFDSMPFFNHKYGPTVIQVAAGMYASWLYMIMNPKIGNKWHDYLPSDFILK